MKSSIYCSRSDFTISDYKKVFNIICRFSFLLFFISLWLQGCTSVVKPGSQADPEIPIISTPQSPFSLQITSVQNEANTLKVEGLIITKASWYIDNVSVRLVGFQDGVEVASIARPLRDFLNSTQLASVTETSPYGSSPQGISLPAESPLAFSLSLPVKNISDYQVALGWGNEAVLAPAKSVVWEEQGLVEVGAERECKSKICPRQYAVDGYLKNDGKELVSAVKVAIRLHMIESAGSAPEEQSEPGDYEQIDLSPLNILPGKTQKVRLRFKNSIDPELVGRIKAVVQIKSVK